MLQRARTAHLPRSPLRLATKSSPSLHPSSVFSLRQRSAMASYAPTNTSQPKWYAPDPAASERPHLKVYNSLTRANEPFFPISSNKVTWYSCGPTVYDSSHLGHARNYVSIDINRRILQDYFGYNVFFVQNVTDIDDKIIIKGRHVYLFDKFKAHHVAQSDTVSADLLAEATTAWEAYVSQNLTKKHTVPATPKPFAAWKEKATADGEIAKLASEDPKFSMHLQAASEGYSALHSAADKKSRITVDSFLESLKPVLSPYLDAKEGSTVTDPAIFRDLAAYWEKKFDDDMRLLNVLPSTVTTRVSEYIPENIAFVKKIIDNGFAYQTSDGSVYFDTVAFEKSGKHVYAKLQPWNRDKQDLIDEGEGSLSIKDGVASGKKSRADFALWKASKPGEPAWDCPWGKGRPGWHIECSVMASEVLGERIDIHTGGIDLAFPHHDNELAQSEAYHDNNQWINYFLHTGHLHIEGQKMSKSLKNFITIKEALEKFSPRQLRLAFSLQQWNSPLDLKTNLAEVKAYESTISKFFDRVKALLRETNDAVESGANISKKITAPERALYDSILEAKTAVHNAFSDNFSVPAALAAIDKLVQQTNGYLGKVNDDYRAEVLESAATWITSIFRILGFSVNANGLGWTTGGASGADGASSEEVALPFVKALSTFRDDVRKKAIEKAPYSEFLTATDKVRSFDLVNLGVSLDDRTEGPALIKFLDGGEKQELIKQREEKETREAAKVAKKAELAKAEEAKRKAQEALAKIKPEDLFKSLPDVAQWDENGIPIALKDGSEVSKSQRKKYQKQIEQHKKIYNKFNSV